MNFENILNRVGMVFLAILSLGTSLQVQTSECDPFLEVPQDPILDASVEMIIEWAPDLQRYPNGWTYMPRAPEPAVFRFDEGLIFFPPLDCPPYDQGIEYVEGNTFALVVEFRSRSYENFSCEVIQGLGWSDEFCNPPSSYTRFQPDDFGVTSSNGVYFRLPQNPSELDRVRRVTIGDTRFIPPFEQGSGTVFIIPLGCESPPWQGRAHPAFYWFADRAGFDLELFIDGALWLLIEGFRTLGSEENIDEFRLSPLVRIAYVNPAALDSEHPIIDPVQVDDPTRGVFVSGYGRRVW